MKMWAGCWRDKNKGNRESANARGINYLSTFVEVRPAMRIYVIKLRETLLSVREFEKCSSFRTQAITDLHLT